MHLTQFEVLTAINHAQLRLNRTFKEEEFANGQVGKLTTAEDFDFKKTVSLTFYKLDFVSYQLLLSHKPQFAFLPTRNIIIMSLRAKFFRRIVRPISRKRSECFWELSKPSMTRLIKNTKVIQSCLTFSNIIEIFEPAY